jgi:hypothetical protein
MRRLLWVLAIACGTASMAVAGPNAGGVLLVHDTGLVYSTDLQGPPFGGTVPTSCHDVDVQAPFGDSAIQLIWKVYAAFPTGGSPRLQGVAWGMDITPQGGGYAVLSGGGLPNPGDFAQTANGFPLANGGWVGQSFPTGTRTALMNEIYWFVGYAYGGPTGTSVQYFCATPPAGTQPMFVDDDTPRSTDGIAGYGCLGFGGPGQVHCPNPLDLTGACCNEVVPACTITTQAACAYTWLGVNSPCTACTRPTGSCCFPDGSCAVVTMPLGCCTGVWTEGGSCVPNVCEQPLGSCCHSAGTCAMLTAANCASGVWTQDGNCSPNPCPQPAGSCCYPDGSCTVTLHAGCSGFWMVYGTCNPSTCNTMGACCVTVDNCTLTVRAACLADGWRAGGTCMPNPCNPPGVCCDLVGTCTMTLQAECSAHSWTAGGTCMPSPCNPPGVCCDLVGTCTMTLQAGCSTHFWTAGGTCMPNPCMFVETEQKTWGGIKFIYR